MLSLEMIDPQQCSIEANIRKEFTQYFVSKSSYGKVKKMLEINSIFLIYKLTFNHYRTTDTTRLSLISFLQFAKTKILYFRNFLPSSSCYFTIVFVFANTTCSLSCYHPRCCLRFAISRYLELEQIHISALS